MCGLIYLGVALILGDRICRRFWLGQSALHRGASAFLVGILISTWVTYLLAVAFGPRAELVRIRVSGRICFRDAAAFPPWKSLDLQRSDHLGLCLDISSTFLRYPFAEHGRARADCFTRRVFILRGRRSSLTGHFRRATTSDRADPGHSHSARQSVASVDHAFSTAWRGPVLLSASKLCAIRDFRGDQPGSLHQSVASGVCAQVRDV